MFVIGLMSGTSVDGIDAALVNIAGTELDLSINLIAFETYPYPPDLQAQILDICAGQALTVAALAQLDDRIAQTFAEAAQTIQVGHAPATLIGSHGQTVFHHPPQPPALGYSLQLGRGEQLAHVTQIPTVSNLRVADIAVGGQGAPLVSKIDVCLLSDASEYRCVQNIGGIGNVTFLPPLTQAVEIGKGVKGWDTGPGNVLIDMAVQRLSAGKLTYDRDGAWAAQGSPCQPLIEEWLGHPYLTQAPPKSTGRELFGPSFLEQCFQDAAAYDLAPADMLATLTDYTAATIAFNYETFLPHLPDRVLVGGGGSHNHYLSRRLQERLPGVWVQTTTEAGVDADAKEAIAFAVLAYWRWHNIPGNLPAVTGARDAVPLGELWSA